MERAELKLNTGQKTNEKLLREAVVMENYLGAPNDESFAEVFKIFTPQLVAFFRARRCELSSAEDLAQEVMLTVHLKAGRIRDRLLFRTWVFKIAHNAFCRHYGKQMRGLETVNLENISSRLVDRASKSDATPPFEFQHWMSLLTSSEREVMTLRFIEQWEYHEIASAQAIPIGTVQWRVFNAKRKLAPFLAMRQEMVRKAA
jgi:RNA polymerase sigma-70 factor (ECF subfamily)